MVDIKNPHTHRPELNDMSMEEMRRRMVELEHAIASREKEEKEKALSGVIEKAGEYRDMVIEAVLDLHEMEAEHGISIIPDRVRDAFTDSRGVFAPAKFWRRQKS